MYVTRVLGSSFDSRCNTVVYFRLFSKLLLEAPRITENALVIVRQYCQDEVRLHDTYQSRISVSILARMLTFVLLCVGSSFYWNRYFERTDIK